MSLRSEFERIDKALEKVVPRQDKKGQEQMGNWKEALPSMRLKAAHFDAPRLLTIKSFAVEDIGDDKRPVIYFNEEERGLVLNITNGNTVEEIAGTADTDNWPGVKVVLYKTQTDYQGKRVDCIRVRAPKPAAPNRQSRTSPPPPPREEFEASDDDIPF